MKRYNKGSLVTLIADVKAFATTSPAHWTAKFVSTTPGLISCKEDDVKAKQAFCLSA